MPARPKPRPADLSPADRARLEDLGRWVLQTCLLVGTSPGTAFTVAGLFVSGLERDWRQANLLE